MTFRGVGGLPVFHSSLRGTGFERPCGQLPKPGRKRVGAASRREKKEKDTKETEETSIAQTRDQSQSTHSATHACKIDAAKKKTSLSHTAPPYSSLPGSLGKLSRRSNTYSGSMCQPHSRGGIEHDGGAGAIGRQHPFVVAADPRRDGAKHIVHAQGHLAQLQLLGLLVEL